MSKNKLISTIVLIIIGLSSPVIVFLYRTEMLDMGTAQTLALYSFGAFIVFGAGYLYFDLKNLSNK